jgi:hypothetical protein
VVLVPKLGEMKIYVHFVIACYAYITQFKNAFDQDYRPAILDMVSLDIIFIDAKLSQKLVLDKNTSYAAERRSPHENLFNTLFDGQDKGTRKKKKRFTIPQ